MAADDVDLQAGKRTSFQPYYYTGQEVPAVSGAHYRLTLRAKVTGDKIFHAGIRGLGQLTICANPQICANAAQGWHDYTLDVTNPASNGTFYVYLRAGTSETESTPGTIRVDSVRLQRDESGGGVWGPNQLFRSDPDTYNYVDQIGAARLDELFRVSEQYQVYHKLTLFHKNDAVLGRFLPDGAAQGSQDINNFYSGENQASRWYQRAYLRYFIARWSYSPALHSLELANENMLTPQSYDAGFATAQYIRTTSPRHILMSNSFWGWFVAPFWTDPARKHLNGICRASR